MSLGLQAVTANRLVDGAVVFRRANGQWVLHVEDAETAAGEAAANALLASAEADAATAIVVAPYLIAVETVHGQPAPTDYRERIRAYGPSRAFHADVPSRHP